MCAASLSCCSGNDINGSIKAEDLKELQGLSCSAFKKNSL